MADGKFEFKPGQKVKEMSNGQYVVVSPEGLALHVMTPEEIKTYIKPETTLLPNPTAPIGKVDEIKPTTTSDRVAEFTRDYIAGPLKGLFQGAAGVGGAALAARSGSPTAAKAGGVAGATAASAAFDTVANLSPTLQKFLGATPPEKGLVDWTLEGTLDRVMSAGVNKGVSLGSKLKSKLKDAIQASTTFSDAPAATGIAALLPGAQSASPEMVQALAAQQGMKNVVEPDLAQISRPSYLTQIRDLFGSKTRIDQQALKNQQALTGQVDEIMTGAARQPASMATGNFQLSEPAPGAAYRTMRQLSNKENTLHRAFENAAAQNRTFVRLPNPQQPGTVMDREVLSPIWLQNAKPLAAQVYNRLQDLIREEAELGVQGNALRLKTLKTQLDATKQILNSPKESGGRFGVVPYEIAKEFKNAAYEDDILKKFGAALSKDIDASIAKWPNATQAGALYKRAKSMSRARFGLKDNPIAQNLMDPTANHEQAIKSAIADKTGAIRWIRAGGSKKDAATALMREAFEAGYNPDGVWNANGIRKFIQDKNEVWTTLTTTKQRKDIDFLLRRMEVVAPRMDLGYRNAMNMRAGVGAIVLGSGAVGGLLGMDETNFSTYATLSAGGAVATFTLGKGIANALLSNPAVARNMVTLLQQKPNSAAAVQATKALFKNPAMQGLRLVLAPADFGRNAPPAREVEIRDGKLVPPRN